MKIKTPITIDVICVEPILAWLKAERGVAVWQSLDLGSRRVGTLTFTPGDKGPPHWQFGKDPVHTTHSHEDFVVQTWEEIDRFPVQAGRSGPCGIRSRDMAKIQKILNRIADATYVVENETAIVSQPGKLAPLEWEPERKATEAITP